MPNQHAVKSMRGLKITKRIGKSDLDIYLEETNIQKPIADEREREIILQIKKGDEEALNKLREAYAEYITAIAAFVDKKYGFLSEFPNDELSVLVEEGNKGLSIAAEMYDSSRGFSFLSYATWWIEQSLLQFAVEKKYRKGKSKIINPTANKH